MPACQKHLPPCTGHNNIEITFYLSAKVVSSLLKKILNCLYYTFEAYIFYYSAYRFHFEPLISALLAAFVSFPIALLVYVQWVPSPLNYYP